MTAGAKVMDITAGVVGLGYVLQATRVLAGQERQEMSSIFRRPRKNKPGGLLIEFTLIGLLTAYAVIQALVTISSTASAGAI